MSKNQEHTRSSVANRLNWLRAGVLGANDGIISTAGIVVAVAAATTDTWAILTAGIAGLAAGAISMALGEYLSVSTQRDTEQALIEQKRGQLNSNPAEAKEWLTIFLRERGISEYTSSTVIDELPEGEILRAHLRHGLGIDEEEIANPWIAAASSMFAFSLGSALPLIAILLPGVEWRIPVTFSAVLLGLSLTGWLSAYLGESEKLTAVIRLLAGGSLAMGVTYGIGQLIGAAVI